MLRRLLLHIDAQLEPDVPPKGMFVGHSYALTTALDRGAPAVVDASVELSPEDIVYMGYPADVRIAHEPTLEQLTQFAETLRGRKVTLFAHSEGSFAQHLTSYLTSWGVDVSHVSTEPGADVSQEKQDKTEDDLATSWEGTATQDPPETNPASGPQPLGLKAPVESVVVIDDDLAALRASLQKIRAEQAYPLHLHPRKRPSLASNHRPRSSPQVARVMGLTAGCTQVPQAPPPVVIVHFTSLAHFKLVKDAVQSMMAPGNTWTRLPEVIVVPKPAGPRRILTALHTAVTKPIVDPFFSPIATSPVSPSFQTMAPVWSASGAQRSPGGRSPAGWRTDRATKSPKGGTDAVGFAPSSPRGISDNMEYFSDAATATKLGSSPSSGLVIQSPDGQPAGIFFHPKPKGTDSLLSERESTHARLGEHSFVRSRGHSFRRASDAEDGKKGVSTSQSDGQRRSSRIPHPLDKPSSAELAYEVASPPSSSKGKSRQPSVLEAVPREPENIVATPSDSTPPPTAPKLPRRTSQGPRYSPPLSPQTSRTPTGPSATRRPAKRPTAESSNSAPAAIPKKGIRSGEPNIVPPISVLIVDGKLSPAFFRRQMTFNSGLQIIQSIKRYCQHS